MRSIRFAIYSCFLVVSISLAQNGGFANRDTRYRLQPLDVLEVHFRYSPELDTTVTVQPDGFISLPVAGNLKLQGLTTDEAKSSILAAASTRLRSPEITLILKEFEKPYFVVGGEVSTPGRFEMHGQVNVLEAIAMAGGLKTSSAKYGQVILYRRVGQDLAKAEILDLRKAMDPGARAEPLTDLRPGDMLMVPQNRISKIERYVKWTNISMYPPL